MNIPPDKRFWRNKPYHPPKRLFSAEELNRIFSSCGTSSRHWYCLTCGEAEDEEHRLNWHLCRKPHILCSKAHQDGLSCAQMEMTYSWYFTHNFFAEHVGVRMECWQPLFIDQYETVRDEHLGRHYGSRGRQHSRNHGVNKGSQSRASARAKHDKEPSFSDFMARFDEYKAFVKRKRSPSLSPTRSPAKRTKGKCYECDEQGHMAKNCPNVVCSRCEKIGHKAEDCKAQPELECGNCRKINHSTVHCSKLPKLEMDSISSTQPIAAEIGCQILADAKIEDAEARKIDINAHTTSKDLLRENQELKMERANLKSRIIQLESRLYDAMVQLQGSKQQLQAFQKAYPDIEGCVSGTEQDATEEESNVYFDAEEGSKLEKPFADGDHEAHEPH